MILDKLPNDVLDIILEYNDGFRSCCKQLWDLFVEQKRRRLRREFGERGYELAMYIKQNASEFSILGNPSWFVIYEFLKHDWCFWGKEHVIIGREEEISDIDPELKDNKNTGCWRAVTGNIGGLYAANVHWLDLRYNTKLFKGIYRVVLNLRVVNFARLVQIRFMIQGASRNWSLCPPFSITGNIETEELYNRFQAVDICLGSIEVEEEGEVQFQIENYGPLVDRGILFNFLRYERIDELEDKQWYLVKPLKASSEFTLAQIRNDYKQLSALKSAEPFTSTPNPNNNNNNENSTVS